MPWLADGMGLIFTLLGLAWTVGLIVAPRYLEFPFQVFVVPTAGMFIFRMAHSLTLYRARVPCSVVQRLGALLAGLSLTHTISKRSEEHTSALLSLMHHSYAAFCMTQKTKYTKQ